MDKHKKSIAPPQFVILAADVVLLTLRDGELLVRLIPVERPPYFVGARGLPGGLLRPDETAEDTALRQVADKAGVRKGAVYTEQLATFSRVNRDPRGRVVAVAYLALIPWSSLNAVEQQGEWVPVREATKLAYDHDEIIATALVRLRSRISHSTLLAKLLPNEFTLTELEEAYELILGRAVDKRNFRKKIAKLGVLKELAQYKKGGKHRPARLYRFRTSHIEAIEVL